MSIKRMVLCTAAAVIMAGALWAALPARAQEPPVIDMLTVRVWPEFDQPSALVFYVGEVAQGTALPVELRLPLPPGVTVSAAAYLDSATGTLLQAESTQEGSELVVTSPNGTFWVEFYDAALQVDGDQRSYTLALTAPATINTLTYEVQSPYGARGLEVQPAGGTTGTDQYGLPVYSVTQSAVAAGSPLTLSFTYTKRGSALTVEQIPAGQSTSGGSGEAVPPASSGRGISPLVWVLAGAGVALVIGGAAYWFLLRRSAGGQAAVGGRGFCTTCGKPVRAGDRFCRHCGAKLK
jgi:hypothetical protein